MKAIIKKYFLNILILWVFAGFFSAVTYSDFYALCLAAGWLTVLQLLIKPVLTLLFMPIQLISLGVLSFVPTILTFYIFRYLTYPQYQINAITLPEYAFGSIQTPTVHLGVISSIIFLALLYRFWQKFFDWLLK